MKEQEYGKLVKELSPNSPMGKDCLWAFLIGGLICVIGQALTNFYGAMDMEKQDASAAASRKAWPGTSMTR